METIKASRYARMKELRLRGGNLRVLFAFDPRRTAILMISTLRRYVEALGGRLELQAVFPDQAIRVVPADKVLNDATVPQAVQAAEPVLVAQSQSE